MYTTNKALLDALLCKYEHSASYRLGEQSNRRILLKLYDGKNKTDFAYYDINDHDRRVDVNKAVLELAGKNMISYEWLPGETNHIISKVWLHYEQLETAYKLAKRTPKAQTVDDIYKQAQILLSEVKSDWAKRYFEAVLQKAQNKRDFGSFLPGGASQRADLWKTISFIDRHSDLEMVERILSMRLFSDSKRFETMVRSKLLGVLRKYLDIEKLCDNDDELLRQVGIVKYPEYFEFCGEISLTNAHGTANFAPLSQGSSMCAADLITGAITITDHIKKIISIENRANYIEYIRKSKNPDELVLYHAGQYSPSKKKFFLAINASMPKNCHWHHWGDMDLGGFSMLARLRREINSDIAPSRMGKEECMQYEKFCGAITEPYADKLRHIMQKPELSDCTECLQYMIDKNIRLEQEAMLFEI